MKSCTWDHSTICIDENIWAWQANATFFTLQRLNTLNTNISVTSSPKVMFPQNHSPRQWKIPLSVSPYFEGQIVYRLISKSNKFKMKVTQGRLEAWHSTANLSRTRGPDLCCNLTPGQSASGPGKHIAGRDNMAIFKRCWGGDRVLTFFPMFGRLETATVTALVIGWHQAEEVKRVLLFSKEGLRYQNQIEWHIQGGGAGATCPRFRQ